MKLKNQVLSIEQVRELQELGFDVKKYASMYYTPNWITKFGIDEIQDYLLQIGELKDNYEGDCIPTLTIGDIIEVLPISIYYLEEYETRLTIKKTYYGYTINYDNIFSSLRETVGIPFSTYKNNYIDALFDCLIWCIKRKYINLK